ncbi:MAG: hypothetical protein EXS18_05290 [Verrucomicrobiae bacterium]|nr:hypothetical protein [Verrucomicrobiae bacterium]
MSRCRSLWERPYHEHDRSDPACSRHDRHPQLHGELSDSYAALSRDPEYGPKFISVFQGRLLFGTDICHFKQEFSLRDLLLPWRDAKKIGETVFHKVAGENAVKRLGL